MDKLTSAKENTAEALELDFYLGTQSMEEKQCEVGEEHRDRSWVCPLFNSALSLTFTFSCSLDLTDELHVRWFADLLFNNYMLILQHAEFKRRLCSQLVGGHQESPTAKIKR